ncbi:MAG: GNAT family N-acetyltransferase [Aerococcaceae bacterium]|nr:GNAT family N-acetyltransferase [Aerococcaceae bacterium]
MLIQSKHKHEKIVLGLLSYTEEGLPMNELLQLLKEYRDHPNRELYLYKDDETENFVGLMGIERTQLDETGSETIVIDRVAVIPSFRNEGIGYQMYAALRQRYPESNWLGALNTSDFVVKWAQKYHQERTQNHE